MLIDFLTDILGGMNHFHNDISTIYLFRQNNNITATGNHPNRLIFYEAVPQDDLSAVVEAPMYLGALPFLNSMLNSTLMKVNPRIEIEYKEQGDKKVCASSLKFIAKSLNSHFECTNPEILNEKDRVKQFPRPKDAIFFPFTKDMRKQFDEVARFNTPKADVRLFTLTYDGNYIRAIFGDGRNVTDLILSDQITGHTEQKISKLISLERFRAMIKLAADNDGKAGYHPNAVWVDFSTKHAIHSIVSPTIRTQK